MKLIKFYATNTDMYGQAIRNTLTAERYKKFMQSRALYSAIKKHEGGLHGTGEFNFVMDEIARFKRSMRQTGYKNYVAEFKPLGYDKVTKITCASREDIVRTYKQRVRDARALRKAPRIRSREFQSRRYGYISVALVGGVHIEPGYWSNLYRAKLAKLVFEHKAPKTSENHVGIELEFTAKADRNVLGLALHEAGVAEWVTLKGDGSIRIERDGHFAHELVICVPESKLEPITKIVTEVLAKFDASVNKSTGMHTHLDARNRDHKKMFARLVSAQGVLYAMQPKSRRDNTYCKRTKSKEYDTAYGTGRYQGVNPQSFTKHRTIEIRLHSGTVSFDKIVNWVKLLIAIVDGEDAGPARAPRTLASFCKAYKIGGELRAYIKSRMDKFGSAEAETESA